jgi:hypothetical protein
MGLPLHLRDQQVGKSLDYQDNHGEDPVRVEKVSAQPPIFILRNFLSRPHCQEIMDSVTDMAAGQTVSSSPGEEEDDQPCMSRPNSQVAWLPNTSKVVQAVARKAHALLLGHRQPFHATRGVEPLQVVRYDDGGEYVLHQDANRRLLTVLYYLNGAGET